MKVGELVAWLEEGSDLHHGHSMAIWTDSQANGVRRPRDAREMKEKRRRFVERAADA
jgi:hypothetical protein